MADHIVFVEGSTTGAGEDAHRVAAQRGCFVTFVTRNRGGYRPAMFQNVDRVVETETNDAEALSSRMRSLHGEHPIDGLTTTADFHVPQAAKAAQDLGLPSLTHEAASGVRNKYKMRVGLQRSCPEFNASFELAADWGQARRVASKWGYPLIAKPQNANDSSEVQLIRDATALEGYMSRAKGWDLNGAGQPLEKEVLLEGYVDGPEYSVETCQNKGGRLQVIGVVRKTWVGGERGFFVEDSAYTPYFGPEFDVLASAAQRALSGLRIDCGVIHTEFRLQNGVPKVLEVNPRLIGNRFGNLGIPLAFGANPLDLVIDIALGREARWRPTKKAGGAMFGVSVERPGLFEGVENLEELQGMEGIRLVDVVPSIGDRVRPAESNAEIPLWIWAEGTSGPDALRLAQSAGRAARIRLGPL